MAPGGFGGPGGPMGGGPMRPPMGGPGRPHGMKLPISHPDQEEKKPAELDLRELEEQSEEMMSLRFLTGRDARFTQSGSGFLSLDYSGTFYDRVQIVRTFPFSDKNAFLSVREYTDTAKEIGLIRDLTTDFPEEMALLIENALNKRYFMPVIEKIHSIRERSGYIYFQVETSKGRQRFTVRNNNNTIIPFSETRLFITDVDNNRYEIPDTTKLNPKELTKLDLYL